MQPGISRELARSAPPPSPACATTCGWTSRARLGRRDRADGLHPRAKGGDLVADFRGERLAEVRVNRDAVRDFEWRNGHLRIPAHHLRGGANVVEARFTTRIAPAGAAIIRFDDRSDGSTYLYTLLVPSDANLLFPCFDQPDLKARFRWRLSAPPGWRCWPTRAPSRATARTPRR
jgi:aminopeptidase N